MTPSTARVTVTEPGATGTTSDYQLGTHVRLNEKDLEAYCWRRLEKVDVDLLAFVGSVALVDRRMRRRRSVAWSRNLVLEMPVYEPDRWRAALPAIRETLEWLTGDAWDFRFRRRRQHDSALQLFLPHSEEPPRIVVPYSGGLDSFAQANMIARRGERALLVTMWHGGLPSVVPASFTSDRVRVPIRLSAGHEREQTYRTRPFMYFAVAALAARLRGIPTVVVSEPGQGAVGPSLVPFGNEHPYRGTHPGFTWRLEKMLRALWHEPAPEFVHPNLWFTKGDLVRAMVGAGGSDAWSETRSCSRDVSRTKGLGLCDDTRQCGVCGNCLLRRVSLHTNGLEERGYFWKDLRQRHLRACRRAVPTTKTDQEVATYAVLDVENLARIDTSPDQETLSRVAHEVGQALHQDAASVEARLRSVIATHAQEWQAFVEALPKHSWLRRVAER